MIAAALLAAMLAVGPLRVSTLTCGDTRFTVTSTRAGAGVYAPLSQRLTRVTGGLEASITLEQSPMVEKDGAVVRQRFVSSWACVRSDRGVPIVVLGYACAVDRGLPGDCGDDREWIRLIDAHGRALDQGVPYNGPVRARLERRLGLTRVMRAGVHMSDALGSD